MFKRQQTFEISNRCVGVLWELVGWEQRVGGGGGRGDKKTPSFHLDGEQ